MLEIVMISAVVILARNVTPSDKNQDWYPLERKLKNSLKKVETVRK